MATRTNTDSLDEVYEYVDEEGNIVEYDLDRLVLSDAAEEKIPSQTEQKMTGFRVKIFDKRPDGKLQDFLIRTEELGSGGVKESHDQQSGVLNGYSLPLYMWNQEGATPSQKFITDFLEKKLLLRIKEKLVEKRDTFRQPELEVRDLKKMGLFYRPKDKTTGKINPDDAPSWYPKLIVSKKKNMRVVTQFYQLDAVNEEGNPIKLDAMSLMDKNGRCRATIKLDSIWIGTQTSLQVKVWEADFNPKDSFLPRKGRISKTAQVYTSENNPLLTLTIGARKQESASPQQSEQSPPKEEGEEEEADGAGDIQSTPVPPPPPAAAAAPKRKVTVNKVMAKKPEK